MPTHVPAPNTDAVVTLAASSDSRERVAIDAIHWSYSNAPAAGVLTVASNGVVLYTLYVTNGGAGFLPFGRGFDGSRGQNLVITLSAGGGGVLGTLNIPNAWFE